MWGERVSGVPAPLRMNVATNTGNITVFKRLMQPTFFTYKLISECYFISFDLGPLPVSSSGSIPDDITIGVETSVVFQVLYAIDIV